MTKKRSTIWNKDKELLERKPTYKELEKKLKHVKVSLVVMFFLGMMITTIFFASTFTKVQEELQTCEDDYVEENIGYFKFSVNMMKYSSEQLNLPPEEFNKGFLKWFAECLIDEDCEVIT